LFKPGEYIAPVGRQIWRCRSLKRRHAQASPDGGDPGKRRFPQHGFSKPISYKIDKFSIAMTLLLSIFSALLWIERNFSVRHAMLYPGLALHQLTGLKNGLSSDKQKQTSCRPLHGGKCSHQHRDYCPGIQLAVLSCFDRLLLTCLR
jgi:hypothetical protein